MDIYNAIMKAADHIEKNPRLFRFSRIVVPECGTPGCALGWIGHFAEQDRRSDNGYVCNVSKNVLGIDDLEFYDRMRALQSESSVPYGIVWTRDAATCAKLMRLYASKFHAPTDPPRTDFIPAEIRALFAPTSMVKV